MRLLVSKIGIVCGAVFILFGTSIFFVGPSPEAVSRLCGLLLFAIGCSMVLNHLARYLNLTSTRSVEPSKKYVYISDDESNLGFSGFRRGYSSGRNPIYKREPVVNDNADTDARVPLFIFDERDAAAREAALIAEHNAESSPFLADDRVGRRHSYIEAFHKNDALIDDGNTGDKSKIISYGNHLREMLAAKAR